MQSSESVTTHTVLVNIPYRYRVWGENLLFDLILLPSWCRKKPLLVRTFLDLKKKIKKIGMASHSKEILVNFQLTNKEADNAPPPPLFLKKSCKQSK